MSTARSVLFLRDFRRLTGGHLKLWHYFEYLDADPRFRPLVALTWRSVRKENPWAQLPQEYRVRRRFEPDIRVLGGLDWNRLPRGERPIPSRPVVNVIQGVRHSLPDDPRFAFLALPAIRICVSPEVAHAVAATGRASGPLLTIPYATDVVPSAAASPRPVDIHVAALKQPGLGRTIAARLSRPDRTLTLQTAQQPREEFLAHLHSARVVVLLPSAREGWFLPALEAMALGAVVVCPDCIGNRSFCLDGVNCFRPDYREDGIVAAAEHALSAYDELAELREEARLTALAAGRERERRDVIDVFENVDELWRQALEAHPPR